MNIAGCFVFELLCVKMNFNTPLQHMFFSGRAAQRCLNCFVIRKSVLPACIFCCADACCDYEKNFIGSGVHAAAAQGRNRPDLRRAVYLQPAGVFFLLICGIHAVSFSEKLSSSWLPAGAALRCSMRPPRCRPHAAGRVSSGAAAVPDNLQQGRFQS